MYHQFLTRLLFRFISNQKNTEEKYIQLNLELGQNYTLNLSDILKDFANREVFCAKSQIFYLDPSTKHYVYADFLKTEMKLPIELFKYDEVESMIEAKKQGLTTITILVKNVSDQTLANPKKPGKKRSKQRLISDVIRCCKEWRRLYREVQSEISNKNMTLDQSAAQVGVSRKTLEDYYLHLKNAKKLNFDFTKFKDQKMGILRNYVKQNNTKILQCSVKMQSNKFKTKAQIDQQEQRQLFKYLDLKLRKDQPKSNMEEQIYQEDIDVGDYLLHIQNQSRSDNSSESEC